MNSRVEQSFIIETKDEEEVNSLSALASEWWEFRNTPGLKQSFKIDKRHNNIIDELFAAFKPPIIKGEPNIKEK